MLGNSNCPLFFSWFKSSVIKKESKRVVWTGVTVFSLHVPSIEKRERAAESCVVVRCWIYCFLHPKDSDWPVCITWECAKKNKNKRVFKLLSEILLHPVQFKGSRLKRKRFAFLQIRRFIHKCLTIEVEQRQSRRESTPASIRKRRFIFLLETKKKEVVAFVSCRKSYTHLSPFSNYFLI